MSVPSALREGLTIATVHPAGVGGVMQYAALFPSSAEREEIERWARQRQLSVVRVPDLTRILVAEGRHDGVLVVDAAPAHAGFPAFQDPPDGDLLQLLRSAGADAARIGDMGMDPDLPGGIKNLGRGTVDQAVQLVSLVKQKVRDTLGIQLHERFTYYGFL